MIPDDDGEQVEYFSCPLLWLNNAPIMEFFEMRAYLEKHPHTAPPYLQRQPRYVAIEKYYTSVVADFEDLKRSAK